MCIRDRDYVKIAYQGTDCLYVPATQLDLVSKYIGAGEDTPVRLNKLGGAQWHKTKAKAKACLLYTSLARDFCFATVFVLLLQRQ